MRYRLLLYVACLSPVVDKVEGQAAETYTFRHINQRDGLVSNTVYTMLQDDRGYLWIGTDNGLQRYDGYRFVTYQQELNPEDKSYVRVGSMDLLGQNNSLICEDKELDLRKNIFSHYKRKDLLERLVAPGKIFSGHGDTTWIEGNRLAYACFGNEIRRYSMAKDTVNDQCWVVIEQGLVLLDGKSKKAYTASDNPLHYPLLSMTAGIIAKSVSVDSRHNTWVTTWVDQFYRYDPVTNRLNNYSLYAIRPRQNQDVQLFVDEVVEDNHQNIWMATMNAGLLKYDPVTDNFIRINSSTDNAFTVQYNFEIFCIVQDREGNIWLGTDRGISIFNPYNQYFQVIRSEPGEKNTLPQREINCVIQTKKGDILAGTWGGGIVVFDREWKFLKKIDFPGQFEENLVWCFLENTDGKIWMGCQHGYINIYDPSSGKISTLHPGALQNSTVRCMTKDRDGNILLGLHNGKLALWVSKEQLFYPYNDSTGRHDQKFAPVFKIYTDRENNCWAATGNGFKKFNRSNRSFDAVYYPATSSSHAFIGITEEDDSTLLVGMVNGGLMRFNIKTKAFIPQAAEDPINTATVHAIQKDRAGNTWLLTDYNLHRYSGGTDKLFSYTIDPGVINSTFQCTGFYELQDGRWVINTYTEILCFDPAQLSVKKDTSFPVAISGMKVFSKPVFVDSFLLQNRTIQLSNKENFLTFEFASLLFSNLRQSKYFYNLSGVNNGWVSTETPVAAYTNLSPGKYTFSVKTEEGQTAELHFIIAPRFWQTWWFITAVFIAAGLLIYFIIRRRITVMKRELALKRQMQETEMMALRAQMNPHFIFNCINSIDAMIQSNDKYHATTYLNKFAKLLRNVLDSSKENTVSLAKDIETLELYIQLEQFRNDNRFSYEIRTEPGLLAFDIRVPPLVIQPYVENAIQHGFRYRNDNGGKLLVHIYQQEGHLFYVVEDNGIGRELSRKFSTDGKKSYGMEMSNDRIRLFNKEDNTNVDITDLYEDGHPSGTRVTVGLKID